LQVEGACGRQGSVDVVVVGGLDVLVVVGRAVIVVGGTV
jgi:hypothetical protein